MNKFYASCFLNTTLQPYEYGLTFWTGIGNARKTASGYIDGYGKRVPETVTDYIYNLTDRFLGMVEPIDCRTQILKVIEEKCSNQNVKILTDNYREILSLFSPFERDHSTVTRSGTVSEQITDVISIINTEKYFIPEDFIYKSDLIFDSCSNLNIIDPIYSDMIETFPITESLLIALRYFRNCENLAKQQTSSGVSIQSW